MRNYFSSTPVPAFYSEALHGCRTILVPDPAQSADDVEKNGVRMIEVPNPDCAIPADAVLLTDEKYESLMRGVQAGKAVALDEHGVPQNVDQPPPTPEDAKNFNAEVQRRKLADAADHIAPLQDAVDLGIATDGEKSLLTGWKQYRVALNRVDLVNPVWPTEPASS
ncbi:tail fiber assembly protein [Burkholderia sp. CCA53]|uniref:tail fiber assembly protein n=1 Tax=Burkholderia sp. CCA53 TaxID=1776288 RepID=UPI0015860A71|nr:tail fiber assembly protein [Burkholderia sp. CCA53]